MPKEMLPVVDKPLIQYAVEEAQAAGSEEFILVTSRGKKAIEDHFDNSYELSDLLRSRKRHDLIEVIDRWLPEAGQVARQVGGPGSVRHDVVVEEGDPGRARRPPAGVAGGRRAAPARGDDAHRGAGYLRRDGELADHPVDQVVLGDDVGGGARIPPQLDRGASADLDAAEVVDPAAEREDA